MGLFGGLLGLSGLLGAVLGFGGSPTEEAPTYRVEAHTGPSTQYFKDPGPQNQ